MAWWPSSAWSADAIDDDDPALIEQLCRQVLPRRGIWATADEVMITLGAQQALYLIIRLLVGPRSVVGVEEPGYPDMRHMASLHAGSLQRLAVDDEGAVPDAAMASCTLALLTPGHQCNGVACLWRRSRPLAPCRPKLPPTRGNGTGASSCARDDC